MPQLPLLLVLGVLVAPVAGLARPVLFTGDPVVVRLQPQQPTAMTFPEPIAAVPTGADPAALALEIEGSRLFLHARDAQIEGLLFVLGVSGRSYPVRYQAGTPPDTEVVVMLPAPAGPQVADPAVPLSSSPPGLTVRGLLVAMLRGIGLPGITETEDRQRLLDTDRLRITTTRVYLAGPLVGYVAEASNRTDAPLPLLLPEYYAPGLKALSAEAEVLPPRGTTRVYLVFHPGVPH